MRTHERVVSAADRLLGARVAANANDADRVTSNPGTQVKGTEEVNKVEGLGGLLQTNRFMNHP